MPHTITISFDNTEYAFAYKKNNELQKARFLFKSMGIPWLINVGLKLTPMAIKWNLPFTKTIIRSTIFKQFVGGETLEETAAVAKRLSDFNVEVILDYAVEGGNDGEAGFDHATEEFIKVINYAATQPNIPFMSVKVTGFSRFELLEKIDELMYKFEYMKAANSFKEKNRNGNKRENEVEALTEKKETNK